MSFDWQTEEEVDWEDSDQPQKEPEKPRRRRSWGVGLLLVLSVTAVSFLIYQVVQRVSTATEAVEDDLLASVTVIQDAAVDGDRMLFSAFLSGRDREWSDANEQLVVDERFLQRPAFGLQWMAVEPETAVISTTLSPDLRSAEVLLKYDYELDVGNGLTDTIELRQTAVYRMGADRWLLAPPEPEFWGETKTVEAGALTVIYPQRDEAVVRELAADWSSAWAGTCALFGDACDRDYRLTIELSTDPASFIDENDEYDPTAVLQLPTPSLVGLPTDRDGYGALYRGYLAQILRPFWQVFLVKECCGGELLYNAAVQQLFQQISGWSVADTAVDWQAIQQNTVTLQDVNSLWAVSGPTEENIQLANALVAFLVDGVGAASLHILQSLAAAQEPTLTEYLTAHMNNDWTAELWEREWQHFVQEQAGSALSPEELPEQDLLMLCRPDWSNKIALYRHDLQQNSTTLVQDFRYQYDDGFILALPDDSGVAFRGVNSAAQTVTPFLLRDNVRYDVLPDNREATLWPIAASRSEEYVLWYHLGAPLEDLQRYAILDVAACLDENECQVEMVEYYPIWSPDGERMIGARFTAPFLQAMVEEPLTLLSGDGNTFLQELDFGASPFWLDENRYAYAESVINGRPELFAATIDEETEPELLLSADAIAGAMPDENDSLFVDYAFADPNDANRLFLVMGVGTFEQFEQFLLTYDLQTGSLGVQGFSIAQQRAPGVYYQLSPDGQWFITSNAVSGDSSMTVLHLYHLPSGRTIVMTTASSNDAPNLLYTDWSADGAWLSYPQNGMIELVALDMEATHLVVADGLYCTGAVWTNE